MKWTSPIVVVGLTFSTAAAQSGPPSPTLSFACETSGAGSIEFVVTLGNQNDAPTRLAIGHTVGQIYMPGSLSLSVHWIETGEIEDFKFFDPSVPGIAGRLDPWLVALPPGATYSFRVPEGHFHRTGRPPLRLATAATVQLLLEPALPEFVVIPKGADRESFLRTARRRARRFAWIDTLTAPAIGVPAECQSGR